MPSLQYEKFKTTSSETAFLAVSGTVLMGGLFWVASAGFGGWFTALRDSYRTRLVNEVIASKHSSMFNLFSWRVCYY